MAQFKDITGKRFHRLTSTQFSGRDKFGIALWDCRCDCGNTVTIRLTSLTANSTKSCGCLNDEVRKSRLTGNTFNITHGKSKHPLYRTWATMKQRCFNPKSTKYPLYGGRGISVSDSWRYSFEQFLNDMGERPIGHTLNRKDNNGDYCKDNCEWASFSDQNSNRRPYKRSQRTI